MDIGGHGRPNKVSSEPKVPVPELESVPVPVSKYPYIHHSGGLADAADTKRYVVHGLLCGAGRASGPKVHLTCLGETGDELKRRLGHARWMLLLLLPLVLRFAFLPWKGQKNSSV